MTIRLETAKDYRAVETLTREAFWNVYRPGCTEHFVINQYRKNPAFIPELSFVMEENGRIIGHVMYSKAELLLDDGSRFPSWTFGPISIHPEYQGRGYGLRLLNYSLSKAREMGVGFLCMEGNINFYRHAGFDLASRYHIHYYADRKMTMYLISSPRNLSPAIWEASKPHTNLPKVISQPRTTPRHLPNTKPNFHKKKRLLWKDNCHNSVKVAA